MNKIKDPKLFRYLLSFLHLFLGINGLIGGLLFMMRPDGSYLHMDSTWLKHSLFSNFFIPGLLLFSFVGLMSIFTCYGLVTHKDNHYLNILNIYKDRNWAWTYSLYSGIITIVWINIQMILTSFFWLQPVIIFIGLAIIIVTLLPGIMDYYQLEKSPNA